MNTRTFRLPLGRVWDTRKAGTVSIGDSTVAALPELAPGEGLLAICYGTRPQIIKASALIDVLADCFPLLCVDTGQHYDYELQLLLYQQLGVQRPHIYLEVGSSNHAQQTAAILTRAAEVFATHRPWAVVVIGDTNSTLGCALAAAKMRIPVIHVESGLRAADANMAEEINRRVVDAISTVLCAPSIAAAERLQLEQAAGEIRVTGDVARDVLARNISRAPACSDSGVWPLEPGESFVFATLHRAELTGSVAALRSVLTALGSAGLPVVFPVHPRTRAVLEQHELLDTIGSTVHVLPPLGYLEALAGIRDACVVVTDSGGVQREAYWLGIPCITVRGETEWVETVRLGANVLVTPDRAEAELPFLVRERNGGGSRTDWPRDAYGGGDAARKICDAIAGLAAKPR